MDVSNTLVCTFFYVVFNKNNVSFNRGGATLYKQRN